MTAEIVVDKPISPVSVLLTTSIHALLITDNHFEGWNGNLYNDSHRTGDAQGRDLLECSDGVILSG